MKKRVKWGRFIMVVGMIMLLGSTLFRAIPTLDWTLSAAIVFAAFGLIVAGLLLAHQGIS